MNVNKKSKSILNLTSSEVIISPPACEEEVEWVSCEPVDASQSYEGGSSVDRLRVPEVVVVDVGALSCHHSRNTSTDSECT